MRKVIAAALFGVVLGTASTMLAGFPKSPVKKCPDDAVVAGTICLDKYEASVWRVPNATTTNIGLVKKIQQGKATAADLTAGGATHLGIAGVVDYAPCGDTGQNCANDIYAVSLPNEMPSYDITWFQAAEACANAGKRLPTNAEWQVGANGTPDPGPDDGVADCNTTGGVSVPTGSRAACVSARGVFDMVGNVPEWVADWVKFSPGPYPGWNGYSNNAMRFSGASTAYGPAAITRGGDMYFVATSGTNAGPLTIEDNLVYGGGPGFRCAR